MLLILFGLPGVGKNYVGNILQEEFNYHFYDADDDLTPPLIEAIYQKKSFNPEDITAYVDIIITRIQNLSKTHPKLAVAQALARRNNRLQLQTAFPTAKFIHITAKNSLANKRLTQRNNWVNPSYAKTIRQKYQPPTLPHITLDNNQNMQHIVQQLLISL